MAEARLEVGATPAGDRVVGGRGVADRTGQVSRASRCSGGGQKTSAPGPRQNFDLARKAVDDYLTTVSQDLLLKSELPGLKPLRKELLEKALRYYQEFLRQRGDDPAQKEAAAAAFYRVGDITGEIGAKPAAFEALRRAPQPVRGAVPIPAPEPVLQHWTGPVLSAHRRYTVGDRPGGPGR